MNQLQTTPTSYSPSKKPFYPNLFAPDSDWQPLVNHAKALEYFTSRGISAATLALVAQKGLSFYARSSSYAGQFMVAHYEYGKTRWRTRSFPSEKKWLWDLFKDGNAHTALMLDVALSDSVLAACDYTLYITNGEFGYLSYVQATKRFNAIGMSGEGVHLQILAEAIAASKVKHVCWLCDNDDAGRKAAAKLRDALADLTDKISFVARRPSNVLKGDLNDALIANPNLNLRDIESFPVVDLPVREKKPKPTYTKNAITGDNLHDKVLSGITIEQLLVDEGIDFNHSNQCKCPFHEDKTPSAAFYPKTNTFHCFVCGDTYNVITFYAKKHGLSNKDAKIALAKSLGIWEERVARSPAKASDHDVEYVWKRHRPNLWANLGAPSHEEQYESLAQVNGRARAASEDLGNIVAPSHEEQYELLGLIKGTQKPYSTSELLAHYEKQTSFSTLSIDSWYQVKRFKEQWVSAKEIQSDKAKFVCVKAQTGKGKTWAIISIIKELLLNSKGKPVRILYVAPYQRLARAFIEECSKHGVDLVYYKDKATAKARRNADCFVTCLPSVQSLFDSTQNEVSDYDIIFIDEIVSCVEHLTALKGHIRSVDKKKPRSTQTFVIDTLCQLFTKAEKVVLLDANLNRFTMQFISQRFVAASDAQADVSVHQYESLPRDIPIKLFTELRAGVGGTKRLALAQLFSWAQTLHGGHFFFFTNANAAINFFELCESHKIPVAPPILGENNKYERRADVLDVSLTAFIDKAFSENKHVIYSPGMATGVDLHYPGKITLVYGNLSAPSHFISGSLPSQTGILIQGPFRNRDAKEVWFFALPGDEETDQTMLPRLEDLKARLRVYDKTTKTALDELNKYIDSSKALKEHSEWLLTAKAYAMLEYNTRKGDFVAFFKSILGTHGYTNIIEDNSLLPGDPFSNAKLAKLNQTAELDVLTELQKEVNALNRIRNQKRNDELPKAAPVTKDELGEVEKKRYKGKATFDEVNQARLGHEHHNLLRVILRREPNESDSVKDLKEAKRLARVCQRLVFLTTSEPNEMLALLAKRLEMTEESVLSYLEVKGNESKVVFMQKTFLPMLSVVLDSVPILTKEGLLNLEGFRGVTWNTKTIKEYDAWVKETLSENNNELLNILKTEIGISLNIEKEGCQPAHDFILGMLRWLGISVERITRKDGDLRDSYDCYANEESAIELMESIAFTSAKEKQVEELADLFEQTVGEDEVGDQNEDEVELAEGLGQFGPG